MTQEHVWDREYRNSKLLTKENKPQSDVVRFVKWLKKDQKVDIWTSDVQMLDLGSGAGRNSFYFTELGCKVTGLEISNEALNIAKQKAENFGLDIDYRKQSIGETFPVADNSVDIVLDIVSSNSLTEAEREVYLSETNRVLKSNGYFFVKALCKDGDSNAKNLLKQFPEREKDTYKMPGLGVVERVWTKEDFIKTYEKYFKVLSLEKKTGYSKMNNRPYKRNFWLAYMQKL